MYTHKIISVGLLAGWSTSEITFQFKKCKINMHLIVQNSVIFFYKILFYNFLTTRDFMLHTAQKISNKHPIQYLDFRNIGLKAIILGAYT